ncbi:DinB family protein [Actinokineospora enzanensis]|uniref:DinB family protein n=1 Tax=Actinokineospora enzanensis TaxID=155975 RepID=UPI0003725BC6|nr:DinB family protein [Actinokineospora enzanensis]
MTPSDTPDLRADPPRTGNELEVLLGFLDFQRGTIALKSTGLSEADAHRSVLPSPLMTVAGLLSHLRWVESYWFENVIGGQPAAAPFDPDRPDAEFEIAAELGLDRLLADYADQCTRSRVVISRLTLEDTGLERGVPVSLRWVLTHMIEETARHAGHLDVIREFLDGVTGE